MKKIIFLSCFLWTSLFLFAKANDNTKVIQSGNRIYNDLYILFNESGLSHFIDNQPMSIGEIKFYFEDIDYESLSESGKRLYKNVADFLQHEDNLFKSKLVKDEEIKKQNLRLFINLKVTPEIYYRTDKSLPWTFDYNIKDFTLSFPVIMGFDDYFTIQSDFFIGKNYTMTQAEESFTNIPLSGDDFEFLFPKFAYGSVGKTFDTWGFNFHAGKEGVTLGKTELGSIIYNKTFETDFYSELNFYTKRYKYTMFVNQVDPETFLYLHQLNFRPFKNLRFSALEGSLLNSPFELRYLNPLMIMHSFGSWKQHDYQMTENEDYYYGEGHFCAYLGLSFDYVPLRNFRVYGLFAQTEILDLGGNRSQQALSTPDGLGGQLGFEYTFGMQNGGFLKATLEASYTSPYLYVKQSPAWSMYRTREEMQTEGDVISWIGSPFGPDCFATKLNLNYEPNDRWNMTFSYLFKIHGENTAENMFDPDTQRIKINVGTEEEPEWEWVWAHYPYARFKEALKNGDQEGMDKSVREARYMWMSGIPEYTHSLSLAAEYKITEHINVAGNLAYTFILNSDNISENLKKGLEIALSFQYKLFN